MINKLTKEGDLEGRKMASTLKWADCPFWVKTSHPLPQISILLTKFFSYLYKVGTPILTWTY
jgi:hypothetical protein